MNTFMKKRNTFTNAQPSATKINGSQQAQASYLPPPPPPEKFTAKHYYRRLFLIPSNDSITTQPSLRRIRQRWREWR